MLFQLQLNERGGQRQRIDGHVQIPQDIGNRADMILMSVREDDPSQLFMICAEIRDVGKNTVDAVHVLVREAHAAVDHDDIVAEFIRVHVFSDLTEPAERNYF